MTAGYFAGTGDEGEIFNMHKFTTGLVAGGLIGAAGVAWAMSDNKTRRRITKGGRQAFRKANSMFDNVHGFF